MRNVREVAIGAEEVAAGAPTAEHLRLAAEALLEDGIVILHNVVALQHLELLRERMLADLAAILGREDVPFNFNRGNVQQDAPPFPPFLFRDILVNDIAAAVTHQVLGPGVCNAYYSGNTALPGDRRQPVHADVGQLWRGLREAPPPFGIVVNVPVVAMSPENGSTEVWPGSHLDPTVSIHDGSIAVPEEALERRRAVAPPVQPTVPAGSIVLRDLRLWHAGMPNHTPTPRPMLAMIHYVRWWRPGRKLPFAAGSEPLFEHPLLRTHARFVEGPIDYLHHNHAYDFDPAAAG